MLFSCWDTYIDNNVSARTIDLFGKWWNTLNFSIPINRDLRNT